MPIDPDLPFQPLSLGVLTLSDTRTEADDTSGDLLAALATEAGHTLARRAIVADDQATIERTLVAWAEDPDLQVILTTGGTGLTQRDVTPEAVRAVADKEIVGFGELFRQVSTTTVGTSSMQSRALGAIVRGTPVFALPGSNGACRDGWSVLRDQLDSRHRPCNFPQIFDRL
jgi:molybdenum cofactor biosynthesis protein B